MTLRCPDCDSTYFHVKEDADGIQRIYCFKTKSCGWNAELNPPVPLSTKKRGTAKQKGPE